jgi:hypothetical protein
VLTLGALAVAVGFATRSHAASVDSCPTPATVNPADTSDCWQVFAYPSNVSAGGNGGLLVAKFHNLGNGTANHVTITDVNFPSGTTESVSGACSSLPCVYGQVKGGQEIRIFIQYVLPANATDFTPQITLSFDERNGSSPTQDTVHAFTAGPVTVDTTANSTSTCLTDPTVTVSTTGQNAIVTNTKAANGLPCLPTTTTIEGQSGPSGSNFITSFTIDGASQGFVTVEIDYATLANGVTFRNLPLVEITDAGNLPVDACLANGLPQTTNPLHSTDSCVFKRAKYLSKGAAITLHVVSSGVDPRYGY